MRIVLAVVVGVVGALGQRAEACSCRSEPFVFSGLEIPVNASLPVLSTDTEFTLTTEGGIAVAAEAVVVPGGFAVVPTQPLAPDAGYTLTHSGGVVAFRTGAGADVQAPAPPILGSFTHSVGPLIARSTCELVGGEGFVVSLSSPVDGVVFQIFTGANPESIDTSSPAMVLPVDPSASFFLGDSSLCSARFPASKMANLAIQVRTVDLAGNVSELSNPLQLKGSGCSATGGSALVLAALLLARKSLKRGQKSSPS